MTAFVRTVLGDVAPAALGITYAHEHLVIDGGRAVQLEPDFELSDVDAMATEVGAAIELGLGAVIDAMPCDCGRSAPKLAELSRRTGLHIVAPTGLHHDRFYGSAHWSHRLDTDQLARPLHRRHRRRDRQVRLLGTDRRADAASGRRDQDRRVRGRAE